MHVRQLAYRDVLDTLCDLEGALVLVEVWSPDAEGAAAPIVLRGLLGQLQFGTEATATGEAPAAYFPVGHDGGGLWLRAVLFQGGELRTDGYDSALMLRFDRLDIQLRVSARKPHGRLAVH